MKKNILLLIGFLTTISLFAQESNERFFPGAQDGLILEDLPKSAQVKKWILDSTQVSRYIDSVSLTLRSRNLYSDFTDYGNPGLMSQWSYQNVSEKWINSRKIVLEYHDGDILKSETEIEWNDESETLTDTTYVELYNKDGYRVAFIATTKHYRNYVQYHRDENNKRDSLTSYEWDDESKEWVIDYRWKNYIYIDNFTPRYGEQHKWDSEKKAWTVVRRFTRNELNPGYEYVYENKKDGTETWIKDRKYVYERNSDNKVLKYQNVFWDKEKEEWVIQSQRLSEYNSNGLLSKSVISNLARETNELEERLTYEYFYDENNNSSYRENSSWDDTENVWKKTSRIVYFWSEKEVLPSDVSEEELASIAIFPNPATDYIQLARETNLTNSVASIYTNTGKLIKRARITEEKSISVAGMTTGHYILVVEVSGQSKSIPFVKK